MGENEEEEKDTYNNIKKEAVSKRKKKGRTRGEKLKKMMHMKTIKKTKHIFNASCSSQTLLLPMFEEAFNLKFLDKG